MSRFLAGDPFLERYSIVIFDEFHERGIDSDLALGLLRLIQQTVRPDLRIVVMSATLATDAIAELDGAVEELNQVLALLENGGKQ